MYQPFLTLLVKLTSTVNSNIGSRPMRHCEIRSLWRHKSRFWRRTGTKTLWPASEGLFGTIENIDEDDNDVCLILVWDRWRYLAFQQLGQWFSWSQWGQIDVITRSLLKGLHLINSTSAITYLLSSIATLRQSVPYIRRTILSYHKKKLIESLSICEDDKIYQLWFRLYILRPSFYLINQLIDFWAMKVLNLANIRDLLDIISGGIQSGVARSNFLGIIVLQLNFTSISSDELIKRAGIHLGLRLIYIWKIKELLTTTVMYSVEGGPHIQIARQYI